MSRRIRAAFVAAVRCGDPGGTYFLTPLGGLRHDWRELYLLDEKIDAATALRLGRVQSRRADKDLAAATSGTLAAKLATGPRPRSRPHEARPERGVDHAAGRCCP